MQPNISLLKELEDETTAARPYKHLVPNGTKKHKAEDPCPLLISGVSFRSVTC